MSQIPSPTAPGAAIERRYAPLLAKAAVAALQASLDSGLKGYDRRRSLARFHRLSAETIESETPDAARAVLREIERAMRAERARIGHWTYDLNGHIALLVAHRAEKARLARLTAACGATPRA